MLHFCGVLLKSSFHHLLPREVCKGSRKNANAALQCSDRMWVLLQPTQKQTMQRVTVSDTNLRMNGLKTAASHFT